MSLIDKIKRLGRSATLSLLLTASVFATDKPPKQANPKKERVVSTQKAEGGAITLEYLIRISEDLEGYNMRYYKKFGIPIEEYHKFKDTAKPNAVVIYPTYDYNGAFETKEDLIFVRTLRENYDVRIRWCSREEQVYFLLKKTPDIKLFVLGGHGNRTTLRLGYDLIEHLIGEKDERYEIDLYDDEMIYYSKNMTNCVTLLMSCSNGKGGKDAVNLANTVYGWVGGQVIASKTSFAMYEFSVIRWHPMQVIIRSPENTYTIGEIKERPNIQPPPEKLK